MNGKPRIRKLVLLLSGLSLDAPLAAIGWQWLLFHKLSPRAENHWVSPLLLFAGTWLVYAGDRILDELPSGSATSRLFRHRFVARHIASLKQTWLLVFLVT